jgi:altronate hydrolase
MNALRLVPGDDAAIALVALSPGDAVGIEGVIARDPVPAGHKIALNGVAPGGEVRKYGWSIGVASAPIAPGDHVHEHNLAFAASARDASGGGDGRAPPPAPAPRTFEGFARDDGRVGTRNHVGVLTSVNCSATVARRIGAAFHEDMMAAFPHVDGVAAFTHTTGCGTAATGDGVDNLRRTLAGYAEHPNFDSVVIIGLGCEVNQIDRLIAEMGLKRSDRLHTYAIQDVGGTAKAIEHGKGLVRELVIEAERRRRAPAPLSALTLGLQCGGSDGWSGVTANPALGVASDLLVAHGGAAILSETPEIYGAENLLLRRAVSPEVARKLIARLEWWEDHVARHDASLDNNPSPGNKKGGLTTILEKSLGAVAKSGSTPLVDVFRYGERIDKRGFVFMDSPGYDPCSATGQIASGANLIAFTTGRGSVFGSKPAPCVKLSSNAALAAHMDDDIDVDCSTILTGESVADAGARVFEEIVAVASGKKSKSEALGLGDEEFVPWQVGAAM